MQLDGDEALLLLDTLGYARVALDAAARWSADAILTRLAPRRWTRRSAW